MNYLFVLLFSIASMTVASAAETGSPTYGSFDTTPGLTEGSANEATSSTSSQAGTESGSAVVSVNEAREPGDGESKVQEENTGAGGGGGGSRAQASALEAVVPSSSSISVPEGIMLAVDQLVKRNLFLKEDSRNLYANYAHNILRFFLHRSTLLPEYPCNKTHWEEYDKKYGLELASLANAKNNPIAAYLLGLEYDVTENTARKLTALEYLQKSVENFFYPAGLKLQEMLYLRDKNVKKLNIEEKLTAVTQLARARNPYTFLKEYIEREDYFANSDEFYLKSIILIHQENTKKALEMRNKVYSELRNIFTVDLQKALVIKSAFKKKMLHLMAAGVGLVATGVAHYVDGLSFESATVSAFAGLATITAGYGLSLISAALAYSYFVAGAEQDSCAIKAALRISTLLTSKFYKTIVSPEKPHEFKGFYQMVNQEFKPLRKYVDSYRVIEGRILGDNPTIYKAITEKDLE